MNMNRLLGNRSKPDDDEVTNDYNECVAEIKDENPYIGQLALHQEAMKRVAQRRAAQHDNNRTQGDFAPQKIAFNMRARRNNKNNRSTPRQSMSRSFIDYFLSSSTNTVKASNKATDGNNNNNTVMAGRRTSTSNDEDVLHVAAYAMRDMELSDSEEEGDGMSSRRSSRSSLGRRLSSIKMRKRHSAKKRRSSSNSSISTLQRNSSDLSKGDISKDDISKDDISKDSTMGKSEESRTDDNEKPQHKNNKTVDSDNKKEEEEIMEFVDRFLAKGGSVNPERTEKRESRVKERCSSLCSVEENKVLVTSGESVSKSITSLGDGSSAIVATDGSLICSWGRKSLNDSELMGDGGDLICSWDSRQSILSNSSAASNSNLSPETTKFPREINVGINADER